MEETLPPSTRRTDDGVDHFFSDIGERDLLSFEEK